MTPLRQPRLRQIRHQNDGSWQSPAQNCAWVGCDAGLQGQQGECVAVGLGSLSHKALVVADHCIAVPARSHMSALLRLSASTWIWNSVRMRQPVRVGRDCADW